MTLVARGSGMVARGSGMVARPLLFDWAPVAMHCWTVVRPCPRFSNDAWQLRGSLVSDSSGPSLSYTCMAP